MDITGWKNIEYSALAEKALEQLQKGQVLAVRMKAVKGGKVQIEFAEKITTANPVKSALGLLNKSDKRFSNSSGARRSWETGEPADVKDLFGFEIPDGEDHVELLEIVPDVNGQSFRLQIIEITESAYKERNAKRKNPESEDYLESKLKRAGAEGNFFYTASGERVVSEPMLVTAPNGTEIKHTYLEGEFKTQEEVMDDAKTPRQVKAVI